MNPWPNPIAITVTVPTTGVPIATFAGGAVQAQANAVVLVDTTGGPVPVMLPAAPTDMCLVIVVDVAGTSAVNPIIVEAQGATTSGAIQTFDPSWNGQGSRYGLTAHIADPASRATWFVFSQAKNAWVPGN